MSDEDYDLFLRAVRRKSEDHELAQLILSLPPDGEDADAHPETDCLDTALAESTREYSLPSCSLTAHGHDIFPLALPDETSASDSLSQMTVRPHRIFIPLKDDSHSSISGSAIAPPTLHSSSSADSFDGKIFVSSPRVTIHPNNTGWVDEFLANFNQVSFLSRVFVFL